jgi:hypothetical protein
MFILLASPFSGQLPLDEIKSSAQMFEMLLEETE